MSLQSKQIKEQFLKEYRGLLLKFDCEIIASGKKTKVFFKSGDILVLNSKKP